MQENVNCTQHTVNTTRKTGETREKHAKTHLMNNSSNKIEFDQRGHVKVEEFLAKNHVREACVCVCVYCVHEQKTANALPIMTGTITMQLISP